MNKTELTNFLGDLEGPFLPSAWIHATKIPLKYIDQVSNTTDFAMSNDECEMRALPLSNYLDNEWVDHNQCERDALLTCMLRPIKENEVFYWSDSFTRSILNQLGSETDEDFKYETKIVFQLFNTKSKETLSIPYSKKEFREVLNGSVWTLNDFNCLESDETQKSCVENTGFMPHWVFDGIIQSLVGYDKLSDEQLENFLSLDGKDLIYRLMSFGIIARGDREQTRETLEYNRSFEQKEEAQ